MAIEILCIHEVYVTRTTFTLTQLLAGPGGTKFRNGYKKFGEKLNDCLKFFYTCTRKKDGTYCKTEFIS